MKGRAVCLFGALILALVNAVCGMAQAQVLYRFTGPGGFLAEGGVIAGGGALYGTTLDGGLPNSTGAGVVYELTAPPAGSHTWTETLLHVFPASPQDGASPEGDLLLGPKGTLFGTTERGGACNAPQGICDGTVFELTPAAGGQWTETVLHSFEGSDGETPNGSLIMDQSGAVYGTTQGGGSLGFGTVFKLTPPTQKGGAWAYQVLFSFPGSVGGSDPLAGPLMDTKGNLYGTTALGGSCYCGQVWALSPPKHPGGAWTETILHQFHDKGAEKAEGYYPTAGLTPAPDGSIYGTASQAAPIAGCNYPNCSSGVVFKLSPPASAGEPWGYQVIHSFTGLPDGGDPNTTMALDAEGNLYGTTYVGGTLTSCRYGCGTVFRLSPPSIAGGPWVESVLSPSSKEAGTKPVGQLLLGADSTIVGTTAGEAFRFSASDFNSPGQ